MEVAEEPAGTEEDSIVPLRPERSRSSSTARTLIANAADGEISGECQYQDEDVICRFCHSPGDSDNPLRYPCACRGTIKFVHQDCLLSWLDLRKISHCEVCKQAISFVPLYAKNTPARLSPWEFVIGTALKAFRVLQAFQLWAYYFFLFFMLVPLTTCCLWELSFVQSFGEARRVLLSYLSVSEVIAGCFLGLVLSVGITLLTLAVLLGFNFMPLEVLEIRLQNFVREDNNRNGARPPPNGFHPVSLAAYYAFAVLSTNTVFICCLVFVPFCIGRIVSLHLLGSAGPLVSLENEYTSVEHLPSGTDGENVSGQVTTFLIGYVAILSFILCSRATVYLTQCVRGGPATWRRIHNAIVTKSEAIFSALRKFVAMLSQFFTTVKRHYLTILKISLILGIKIGPFPFMCGLWLDVCTLRIFGAGLSRRVELFVSHPFAYSVLHWIVGILYLLFVFLFVDFLQVVLHKRVFFLLPDIANPKLVIHEWKKSAMHQHFCHIVLYLAIHGSLMVLLVFLPIELVVYYEPSIFPLLFRGTIATSLVDMLHILSRSPGILRFLNPSTAIKALTQTWLTVVGSVLGLNQFLLAKPEGHGIQANGNVEPVRQHRPHCSVQLVLLAIVEGSIVQTCALGNTDVAEDNSDEKDISQFSVRILLLLVLAWITALLFNSIIIALPIILGRPTSETISRLPIFPPSKTDDMDTLFFGSCITVGALNGAQYAIDHVQKRNIGTILKQSRKWGGTALKSFVPLSILIFVIPVLSGLLFDLTVVVPIRVPLDESPVFALLLEDLLIGWLLLAICFSLVMADDKELFVDRTWRMNVGRVLHGNFFQLSAHWMLREIGFPIMGRLLTALCVPHVFARCIFPLLGYPLSVNSAVYRFAWLSWLALGFLLFCAKIICALVIKLHDSIRDEHYKIGRRLKNFGEDAKQG